MIRVIFAITVTIAALGFINCGGNKVVYKMAEQQFVFQRDSLPYGEQKILSESVVSFVTYEFKEGAEPLKIYVRFNSLMPGINSIDAISLELQEKNEKGETITVKPKELQEFKVEYSNGRTIVSTALKNDHIGSQIN